MRHNLLARRAGVPVATVLLGLLAAGPAFADVTVSPATAAQGSGVNLKLHVTNNGTQPVGKITMTLPEDTPIAEVYPLSVEDWAPKIVWRKLATPLPTIHGGAPATETGGSIIWFAMPGKALPPGKSTDVAVAVGPLPTLSAMRLDVSTTYTDGKPGPAMPPATLTLTPSTGQAPDGHGGHGTTGSTDGTDGAGSTAAEEATFAAAVAAANRGPSFWSIAGWVVAALAALGAGVVMFRGRHRAEEDDEPDEDDGTEQTTKEPSAGEPKDPVTAGSKWSYRG